VAGDTPREILCQGAAQFNAGLSPAQLDQFQAFLTELQKWNQRVNLTAAKSLHDLVTRHVLDSLAGLPVLTELPAGSEIADLGSGAGFPGLAVKIARPDLRVTLIEPRAKRAAFLLTVCAKLGLDGVEVVEATIDPKHGPPVSLAGRFAAVLTRAVIDPEKAKALAGPLLAPGGSLVIWASQQQAGKAGSDFTIRTYKLPDTSITHALLLWHPG
jgi:16S rRNA (guanine527-N7)-methyltransferase